MLRRAVQSLLLLAAVAQLAQTTPAVAPATTPAASPVDLSSPKATTLSLYAALKAGDIPAAKKCLLFANPQQAETFELTVTPLYAPLRLMHAMEGRYGEAAAKKLFSAASLEKTLDKAVDDLSRAEIAQNGDTAVIAEKKAAIDPAAETEITGITLKKQDDHWLVVASTFPDITAEIPPQQIPLARSMKDAVADACRQTIDRLAKGEFKTADEAYATYQSQIQQAAHPTTAKAP